MDLTAGCLYRHVLILLPLATKLRGLCSKRGESDSVNNVVIDGGRGRQIHVSDTMCDNLCRRQKMKCDRVCTDDHVFPAQIKIPVMFVLSYRG